MTGPDFVLKLSNTKYENGQSFAGGGEDISLRADFEVTVDENTASGHAELLLSDVKLGALLAKFVKQKEDR